MSNTQKFQNFFDKFVKTELWANMEATVENSPWHREANVSVHTLMVLDNFAKFAQKFDIPAGSKAWIVGALAALFHDVGKPAAKVEKFKPERGTYFAFHGHEQMSARLMEDYFMKNQDQLQDLGITHDDLYWAMWMVEYHLPFDLVDKKKVAAFRHSVATMEQYFGTTFLFAAVLLGDQHGRISDDQEAKLQRAHSWVEDFYEKEGLVVNIPDTTKEVQLLIGASGVGKSTYRRQYGNTALVFSNDDLRMRFARDRGIISGADYTPENYRVAWEYACKKAPSEFAKYSQKALSDLLTTLQTSAVYEVLIIDNTNLTKKIRRSIIDSAQHKRLKVVAVHFMSDKETLRQRALARTDHKVPMDSIMHQYNIVQLAQVPEVHQVKIVY